MEEKNNSEEKNALRCLRSGLEMLWTNKSAMKRKVASAKRLEKTWYSVI